MSFLRTLATALAAHGHFLHRERSNLRGRQVSRVLRSAADNRPDQGFTSLFVTAPDDLLLHVRIYGSRTTSALPVVCLPGLARTAADFHGLATALSAEPAEPRWVVALDYRGHGQIRLRQRPRQLWASPRSLGPFGSPSGAEHRASHIRGHLARRHSRHDAGAIAADHHGRCNPQRHWSGHRATGFVADQGLYGKASRSARLRGGWRDPAQALLRTVLQAHAAGLDRLRKAYLARARGRPRARL